jgi:hypothetical protein
VTRRNDDDDDKRLEEELDAALGFDRPPRHLRPFHRHRWLARLWLEVAWHVRRPAVVRDHPRYTCVEVLGLFRYFRQPSGRFDVYARRFGDASSSWEPVDADQVSIVDVPYRDTWVRALGAVVEERFPSRIEREARAGAADERAMRDAYVAWAAHQLAARVRREFDLRAVRHRIAHALRARSDVVTLARRIPPACESSGNALRVEQYNRVLASWRDYRRLADEAPNLVPLFGVLSPLPGFPRAGEATQRLRDFLWVRGVSEAGWRIVTKAPARLWLRHLEFYRGPVGEAAIDILRLVDLLRAPGAPPAWFLRQLFALRGNYSHRLVDFVTRWAPHMRTLQRLAQLVANADAAGCARMRDVLLGILAWTPECADLVPPRALRQYEWHTFVRRATQWREIERRRVEGSGVRWPVPFERHACGPYDAVVLADAFALWQEGERMRHCIGSYDMACADREALVVSLRDPARERPLCDALYQRDDGRWRLAHAAAFANARPHDGVWRHLAALESSLNALPDAWRGAEPEGAGLERCFQRLEADAAAREEARRLIEADG